MGIFVLLVDKKFIIIIIRLCCFYDDDYYYYLLLLMIVEFMDMKTKSRVHVANACWSTHPKEFDDNFTVDTALDCRVRA